MYDGLELWKNSVRVQSKAIVDSQNLKHGSSMICDGVPSFQSVGVGGQSFSNFLASTEGTVYQVSKASVSPLLGNWPALLT